MQEGWLHGGEMFPILYQKRAEKPSLIAFPEGFWDTPGILMSILRVPKLGKPTTLMAYLKAEYGFPTAKRLFREKAVRVNGIRGREEDDLHGGEELRIFLPRQGEVAEGRRGQMVQQEKRNTTLKQKIPTILYEDAHCLVADKPAGIAVHEARDVPHARTFLAQLEAFGKKEGFEPHLVHRIDAETSGCLVVAKDLETKAYFEELFRNNGVDKEYLVLVKGVPDMAKGTIDTPLPGRDRSKVNALTLYETEKKFYGDGVALLRVRIMTGRMHQIRKHMASIGHPVVMDPLYGDFAFNKLFRKAYGLKRLFLHARSVSFPRQDGKRITVTSLVPRDLADALARVS